MTDHEPATDPDTATATATAPDVVVVGGGIGGLSAAVALSRNGLTVRVLERAREFGEVGAGLQIAPNCTRILDQWGLLDEVRRLGVQPASMVMYDALDGHELTRLDLDDATRRYGYPYLVIHRSDLHATLLCEAQRLGVDLVTSAECTGYRQDESSGDGPGGGSEAHRATALFADGREETAPLVIAADGMHSVARRLLVDDEPVSSAYVAYRGAVPIDQVRRHDIHDDAVVLYVGPGRHFVQYPLRGGEMFNQVAVFESPKALAGEDDWGTPEELDAAFEGSCRQVQEGLPLMWRDRWWRMYDKDPIDTWVAGRVVLLGDAAHPPLQYMAQGAIMAMEDAFVLAHHLGDRAHPGEQPRDWDAALAAYQAVRTAHCRRVQTTARAWGELWHVDGEERAIRNALLESRAVDDYHFTDWIWGRTSLTPEEEPPSYAPIPLEWSSVPATARV